jgi:hypothetical protein
MIPSVFPSFEVLVTLLMAGLLSRSLTDEQRVANFVAASRTQFPSLLPDEIRARIAKAISETGLPPRIEMLCAELPHLADQISTWAKEPGAFGSEFVQVVDWSVEYERRGILTNGLPVIVGLLQKGETCDSIVQMLQDAIRQVSSGKSIVASGSFNLRAWYEREEQGPMWYVEQLDWIVGGMVAGSLAVIGGFTGSLKTTFAINVLYNDVVNMGYDAVFYSFEMTREQLLIRLIVRHAQHKKFRKESMDIAVSKVIERELSPNEEEFLFNKVQPDLFGNPEHGHLIIRESVDLPELSLKAIEEDLTEVNAECGGYLQIVFIDYLQMLGRATGNGRASDGYYQTGAVARWAKNLAMEFQGRGLTVFLLAQFSRAKHNEAVDNDGIYDLSAFAESAEIERAADYAVSIYYGREEKSSQQARMQLLKNRHGRTIEEPFDVLADPDHVWVGDFTDDMSGAEVLAELLADEPDLM